MSRLRYDTPPAWQDAVRADLVAFMQDHCHNERKAAVAAMTLAHQQFRKPRLVEAMIDLAQEELTHFRQVHDALKARGELIGQDKPDPYAKQLHRLLRKPDMDAYLLDRLLVFSLVELRGCERFRLAAEVMPTPELKALYTELYRCEALHHGVYVELARHYAGRAAADARIDELLDAEADIVRALPIRAALH